MEENTQKQRTNLSSFLLILLFPLATFYFEFVFHASTVEQLFDWSTINLLMFSLAYGVLGYLLTTIVKKPLAIYISTIVLLALLAVPYLVQYFVYRQFKVYYDLATMTGGAKDAMGGFQADIKRLLISWDGFFKIYLFFLPAILYAIFGRKLFKNAGANWLTRVIAVGAMLLLFGGSLLLVYKNEVALSIYKTEYNYQTAVEKYGLITGMRLDVQNLVEGEENEEFEMEEIPTIPTLPPKPTEPGEVGEEVEVEPPKEYGYNVMDLDLEGGSGSIKKLNEYVKAQTPTQKNEYTGIFEGKNLIFITAEAFTAELIDPELTPTLYRLANKGIQFTDYYQPASAGTTGGEYQNVFGMLPTSGGASFKKTAKTYNYMTIGSQLDRLGYYGKAYHNNSYTYYSRNKTHVNLGYSDGFMGFGNGMEKFVKNQWPESDLEMFMGTVPTYIDKQPFNIYYMTVSGHSAYSKGGNKMTAKHWDRVADLPYSKQVRGYFAANLELEDSMAYLLEQLEEKGILNDTVICISTDHFPYGLDSDGFLGNLPYLSELYGYDVKNYMQRDHSRLILWCGSLEDQEPIVVDTPTSSLDILPTLSNLFGTEFDSRLFVGRDVFSNATPLVFNTNYDWKTDLGTYYASKGKFVPADDSVEIPDGYVDAMKAVVRNKYKYCSMVLNNDYFGYLFKKK